nr:MAG TPA: protein of unknown function (DUF4417) [Caudoviricetes sp.]
MADKSNSIAYENLNRRIFDGVGKYGIPQIYPESFEGECEFAGFNYARGNCRAPENKAVHFFLDDYQFDGLWRNVNRYVDKLAKFRYVLTPDFSTYTDFPLAIQIYNHYRKHWVGAYLQEHGCRVIPTISWSTPDSYDWCFDGEPDGGTVAVSSVGCIKSKAAKELFISGYNAMVERLHPETIIFYGIVPPECNGNLVRVERFTDKFAKATCEG